QPRSRDEDRIAGVLDGRRQQAEPVFGGPPPRHLLEDYADVAVRQRVGLDAEDARLDPLVPVGDLAEVALLARPRDLGVLRRDLRFEGLRQRLAERPPDLRL